MHPVSTLRLAIAVSLLGVTAGSARPAFVEQALEPSGQATVEAVVAGSAQDLVVLDGGLAAGFRAGMVLVVERDSAPIARLLVAEAVQHRAVALILELAPQQTIQPEDRVMRSLLSIS